MRYLGGKTRSAKAIMAAILGDARPHALMTFTEPFMGGGSVMVEAARSGAFYTQHASDADPLVVCYWQAIASGWVPPTVVTEEDYRDLRRGGYVTPLTAHAAYNCSFGGKRWGGYARGTKADGTPRNFADESSRRDSAVAPIISRVKFTIQDYATALEAVTASSVLYCDPPYQGTTGYKTGAFDHETFWRLMTECANRGAFVYVSEYAAPAHVSATMIWSRSQAKSVSGGTGTRPVAIDKLFRIHPA